jgi:hypothetical protein
MGAGSKQFFFEKKNQKTFFSPEGVGHARAELTTGGVGGEALCSQSFLLAARFA